MFLAHSSGDGTIDPAKLGNVTLRSADPFKTYTLNENGTVTVADRVFAETAWTGATSSVWGENGNWSTNAPDAGSKAIFGAVNNKMVQTSSGAAADVLEFTAPGYVVYGSDAVSVGVAINNTASGQVSIASPITLGEDISFMGSAGAETMLTGSLSGTGVAATKSGSSKVTVSGNNTGLEAAWTINGGTLAFAREEAFGASVGTMELDSGTLAYTGENAGTLPGKLVVSGPSGYGVVVDTAGDLTVTNVEVTGGRLVKKGVGTLTLDLPAGRYNLVDVNDARFDNPGTNITFPVSGDTSESTTMFNPLTVVEGKMVIEGNGSNETRVVGGKSAHRNADAEDLPARQAVLGRELHQSVAEGGDGIVCRGVLGNRKLLGENDRAVKPDGGENGRSEIDEDAERGMRTVIELDHDLAPADAAAGQKAALGQKSLGDHLADDLGNGGGGELDALRQAFARHAAVLVENAQRGASIVALDAHHVVAFVWHG